MGLSDGRKSFPIGLAVLIQYTSVTATQPASHVAVAITLYAKASSAKSRKKHTWVEHFTPTPKRSPFTYTFRFVLVGWGHRRNLPCQVSSQSVQGFRLPKGSKFTISHRLGQWLLQQCYTLTCYTVIMMVVESSNKAEIFPVVPVTCITIIRRKI